MCVQCGVNPKYRNRSICLDCLATNRKAQRAADPERAQAERDYHKAYRQTPQFQEQKQRRDERRANDPEWQERKRERQRLEERGVWLEVLNAYGNQCACCGEAERCFLTIDHVNRDGAAERRIKWQTGNKLYRELRRQGFPQDRYQLLCYNCNLGRERNAGVCPHQVPAAGIEPA